MHFRPATADDVPAIAHLHADSWRRNYRGAYADDFLDGDVTEDRMAVWTERLSQSGDDTVTILAELDGAFVGFAHTILDQDPRWGALLDNLHVVHDRKGQGLGTALMGRTARAVMERRPASGLYLWVLETNTAAQAFYEGRGGRRTERKESGPQPGGGTTTVYRYVWPDPSTLVAGR